jgi:hypothetical protein
MTEACTSHMLDAVQTVSSGIREEIFISAMDPVLLKSMLDHQHIA